MSEVQSPPKDAVAFISLVGRKRIRAELGVSAPVISDAVSKNIMPPSWFEVCDRIAKEFGFGAATAWFSMRRPVEKGCPPPKSGAEHEVPTS